MAKPRNYRDRHFGQRFSEMGDTAEGAFEEIMPFGKPYRYGWNRNADHRLMPDFVSYTPDYYTGRGALVEVMGCSGAQVRAVKVEKWEAMRKWSAVYDGPLLYFFWNSGKSQWTLIEHEELRKIITKAKKEGRVEKFDSDGVEYYALTWAEIVDRQLDGGVHQHATT